jgi:hypothetical protein
MPRTKGLPSRIHKELQRTALLVGLDTVYQKERTNDKNKKDKLYELFHGDPNDANRLSLVDHIFEGTSYFTGLYDEVTDETGVQRVLKNCLSRDPKCRYVAGEGKDITKEILHAGTMAKSDYAIPKTLWSLATDTLCECKKALAIATPYLARYGGNLPSGATMQVDYYNHILDGMWLSQKKAEKNRLEAKLMKDNNDGDDAVMSKDKEDGAEMDNAAKRPETYMFAGFVAFALMGPYVPEGFESNRLLKLFDRDIDEEGSCSTSKKLKKRLSVGQQPDRNKPSWQTPTGATRSQPVQMHLYPHKEAWDGVTSYR